jgi:GT2 family glycosyltransferase
VLSIVIPVFNQVSFTKQLIKDFTNLLNANPTLQSSVEIIVINNSSSDGTKSYLETEYPFTYKTLDCNVGFSKAVNIGYSLATKPYVCFLNNDVRLCSGNFVESVINAIQSNPNSILGPTGGFVDSKYNFKYETDKPTYIINYISGWCVFSSKEVFDKLKNDLNTPGPFWEGNFAYFEDTYMGFHATKLGIQLKLSGVPAKHIGKVTSKTLNMSNMYLTSKQNFIKIMAK